VFLCPFGTGGSPVGIKTFSEGVRGLCLCHKEKRKKERPMPQRKGGGKAKS